MIKVLQIPRLLDLVRFGSGGDHSFADTKVVVLGEVLEEVVITVLEDASVGVKVSNSLY